MRQINLFLYYIFCILIISCKSVKVINTENEPVPTKIVNTINESIPVNISNQPISTLINGGVSINNQQNNPIPVTVTNLPNVGDNRSSSYFRVQIPPPEGGQSTTFKITNSDMITGSLPTQNYVYFVTSILAPTNGNIGISIQGTTRNISLNTNEILSIPFKSSEQIKFNAATGITVIGYIYQ